jgi:hypothetical protein
MEDMTDKIIAKLVEMDAKLDMMATKDDLHELEGRMLTSVDRFVKLHEVLDHEPVAMRSKYDQLEECLTILEQKFA